MESTEGAPLEGSTNAAGGNVDATLAVKVALNIRPLIGLERVQGCKDCITVVAGEPQVQIGSHSFTFDHVYGSTGTPMSLIFDECVAPLVEGLFQGYNATVLAYGQTGSGKTYTMGTGYTVGGSTEGVIPNVMDTIFQKAEILKAKADFQIRVSFIEILKEEVHDLLDPNPPAAVKADLTNGSGFGGASKTLTSGKPPIQIRETSNGGITLAGVTETDVTSQAEMALCLEQGSLCRATGSTMMNTQSSRSHAIFTITLEQRRRWDFPTDGSNPLLDEGGEDYLCAKLHLVDLAGSERAKKTGADGLRFKEGVHINKGLLALGNVISALGDEKKRKEGGHVPYRDSKLTRLLQDSLGGNSRTVMIACVSPADSNAEETLNTLKYANRARNIQNKPTINRDPMAAEMQRMRQQLELMQAELLCARTGSAPEEVQLLKQKIAWLETSNMDLRQELVHTRGQVQDLSKQALAARVDRDKLRLKLEKLRSGKTFAEVDSEDDTEGDGLLKEHLMRIQELEGELRQYRDSGVSAKPRSVLSGVSLAGVESPATLVDYTDMASGHTSTLEGGSIILSGEEPAEADEAETKAKEDEHNMLQENLDKELQELNKRLEQKEAEMKSFVRPDAVVLKQHFEKKLVELEEEKKCLQRERDMLVSELEALATTSDEQTHKMQETYVTKLKTLESQILDLKKKQENQSQHLRAKQRADEAAKRLQEEIHRIKTQKVQLQQKIKSESEQFRSWKASREKEVLQLRKEGRRNENEMVKLKALHQRQKQVLQRKTEEAAAATRRLKDLLEARKSTREAIQGGAGASAKNNEKSLQHWLDQELEMAVRVHEVRLAYEKHMEERADHAKELAALKEEEELLQSAANPTPSMSPGARNARILLLETMLNSSSAALVAMASQLSEAEERERISGGRARWQHLRSMADAKSLLQQTFDAAASAKCRLGEIENEEKEFKEKSELERLLRQSEIRRKELERQIWAREHSGTTSLTTVTRAGLDAGMHVHEVEKAKSGTQVAGQGPKQSRSKTLLEQLRNSDEVSTGNDSSFPYALRKAGRVISSTKDARCDEIDSSEGELDMDTDQSDEEWNEDSERQAVRRNRALGGFRLSRSKSLTLDRKLSSGSPHGSHNQEEESCGFNVSRSSSGESVLEDNQDKERELLSVCACSCSQSSGCKTKKCECKAAGGLCGPRCGCKAGKCNNREAVALEEESSSVAHTLQVEMAKALASIGVDKTQRRIDDPGEARESAGNGMSVVEHVTKRAERLLAVHGATLLETAWKEESQGAEMLAEIETQENEPDTPGEGAPKKPQRRALKDIGNTKVSVKGRPIAKQRRRQTALIQLVPITPFPTPASGIAATASALAAATVAAATNTVPPNVPPTIVPELVSPLWRQHSLQRRTNSPQLSPLRLRANKVGDSNSGAGASNDDGGAKNTKMGSGSGSPSGPARRTDEKENIQRNSLV